MKMRTAYLKVADMETAVTFWQVPLGIERHKKLPYWSEFKLSNNVNFGLLWMEGFKVQKDQSNFVPVFEMKDDELEIVKNRALGIGAKVVVDIADHPDKKSYVLSDPFGNEFEPTGFHD